MYINSFLHRIKSLVIDSYYIYSQITKNITINSLAVGRNSNIKFLAFDHIMFSYAIYESIWRKQLESVWSESNFGAPGCLRSLGQPYSG